MYNVDILVHCPKCGQTRKFSLAVYDHQMLHYDFVNV